ncbi:MAG: hypothetical protein AB7E45_00660 [Candidatus Caldatribacteriota bacterium]
MEKVGNKKEKEYMKNGLKILAKIIIRKHFNENMEKEGDGENERDCNRCNIYDQ